MKHRDKVFVFFFSKPSPGLLLDKSYMTEQMCYIQSWSGKGHRRENESRGKRIMVIIIIILQSRTANNRGNCKLLHKGRDVCESREGFVRLNLTEDTKFQHGIYCLTNQLNDRALHMSHSKLSC